MDVINDSRPEINLLTSDRIAKDEYNIGVNIFKDPSNQVPVDDKVNHPPHYTNSPAKCDCGRRIECIDVTRHMSFNIGNVIKYLWRSKLKNGLEDLKKAQWYLNDAIAELERN